MDSIPCRSPMGMERCWLRNLLNNNWLLRREPNRLKKPVRFFLFEKPEYYRHGCLGFAEILFVVNQFIVNCVLFINPGNEPVSCTYIHFHPFEEIEFNLKLGYKNETCSLYSDGSFGLNSSFRGRIDPQPMRELTPPWMGALGLKI